jgi:hypothetical protein
MAYIGSKPADAVLETDDITDGVITTSKLADNSVTTAKTSYSDAPFRNIIINGDMSIAQRSTSVASITASGYYTVDRFKTGVSIGTWTQSQSTDVPSGQGFATSLKMDCTTAEASPAAGDALYLLQGFEGQNLQYLKKGTANAVSLTASFWVKSTKTGTFILELNDADNVRSISKSYTVDVTDTWEKKTITFEGDTTGALDNDNAASLNLFFWLGAGSNFTSGTLNTTWNSNTPANRAVGQVNIADSTSNDWYITAVQLEAGTTLSDFEFLPVDVNLDRCLRYYQLLAEGSGKTFGNALYNSSSQVYSSQQTFKIMRATPSLDIVTGTNYYEIYRNNTFDGFNTFTTNTASSTRYFEIRALSGVSGTAGQAGWLRTANASSYIAMDSEL